MPTTGDGGGGCTYLFHVHWPHVLGRIDLSGDRGGGGYMEKGGSISHRESCTVNSRELDLIGRIVLSSILQFPRYKIILVCTWLLRLLM